MVYRKAIERNTVSIQLHMLLCGVFEKEGKIAERDQVMDQVVLFYLANIESNPDDSSSHRHLALIYLARDQRAEARAHYRLSLKQYQSPLGLNGDAMRLAASPDPKNRDGELAVEVATKACLLTGWGNPGYLDTLATAYAELGDFDAAVKWQTKAIDLLPDEKKKENFRMRLKLYQEKKPYRGF